MYVSLSLSCIHIHTVSKSEAIDAFGMKYLLGVFETKGEAEKAFADWNSEYEKARSDMKAEMQQWSKQEQAPLFPKHTSVYPLYPLIHQYIRYSHTTRAI